MLLNLIALRTDKTVGHSAGRRRSSSLRKWSTLPIGPAATLRCA